MPVFVEGRVEHQKRNQTATVQLPVGFVFGVQLDYSYRLKSVSAIAEKRVLLTIEMEERLKKTKLLTVVDGREEGWVKILKNVDGC